MQHYSGPYGVPPSPTLADYHNDPDLVDWIFEETEEHSGVVTNCHDHDLLSLLPSHTGTAVVTDINATLPLSPSRSISLSSLPMGSFPPSSSPTPTPSVAAASHVNPPHTSIGNGFHNHDQLPLSSLPHLHQETKQPASVATSDMDAYGGTGVGVGHGVDAVDAVDSDDAPLHIRDHRDDEDDEAIGLDRQPPSPLRHSDQDQPVVDLLNEHKILISWHGGLKGNIQDKPHHGGTAANEVKLGVSTIWIRLPGSIPPLCRAHYSLTVSCIISETCREFASLAYHDLSLSPEYLSQAWQDHNCSALLMIEPVNSGYYERLKSKASHASASASSTSTSTSSGVGKGKRNNKNKPVGSASGGGATGTSTLSDMRGRTYQNWRSVTYPLANHGRQDVLVRVHVTQSLLPNVYNKKHAHSEPPFVVTAQLTHDPPLPTADPACLRCRDYARGTITLAMAQRKSAGEPTRKKGGKSRSPPAATAVEPSISHTGTSASTRTKASTPAAASAHRRKRKKT